MKKNRLPEVKDKKKINVKKFESLAKKIKKYFEEEDEYLRKKDENRASSGLLVNY